MTWRRAAVLSLPAALAALLQTGALAQNAPACAIVGRVTANRQLLPGVVVSLTDASHAAVDITSSAADGSFSIKVPGPGQYRLKSELVAFATATREVTVDAACRAQVQIDMTLASRAPTVPIPTDARPMPGPTPVLTLSAARGQTGRGTNGRTPANGRGQQPQQFQSLELLADQAGLARPDENATASESAAQAVLPPGFSTESSAESVTALGTVQGADSLFGPGGPGERLEAMREAFGAQFGFGGEGGAGQPGQMFGGPGGGRGGDGGGRGGPGGFGGFGGPGFGGRARGNQVRGNVFQSFDTSALDAAPYGLNGQPSTKPGYLQQRFGATLGGPVAIPHLFNAGPRTFFFLNYTGTHARTPYDQYSTVPTAAERAGDLASLQKVVVDPATRQPFAGNQIPASQIDPASARLLALIPLPNQAGPTQNFHNVTTSTNQLDDINVRFVHNFGAQGRGRGGQRGGGGGAGAGRAPSTGSGQAGGRGGRGGSNLNVTLHYRHARNTNQNPFPTLGGATSSNAWDIPVAYSVTQHGIAHMLRFQFNRQHSETTNLYAFNQDVAGEAGLLGVASDPFDWGAPAISMSSFSGVRDVNPASRTDRTLSFGDTMVKTKGRQTLRFGGDYRDIRLDSRADANARGSFVFSGLFSGVDFADFLLGLPQQATVQYGPGLERFRSRSWDLFAQDDWRVSSKMTLNLGLRYEYFSPVSEAANRLATLDVAPDFTAAVPVRAGGAGPYAGDLPDTIVRPFRTGFAPRVGVAWRARPSTTIRAGYGINYSNSTYQSIAQQLAGQPPFAVTGTVLASPLTPLRLESALLNVATGATTNTFAVDPNYRIGYVQIWNLDVQRDLSRTITSGVGYTGTRGLNLDILRAPNRGPTGLRIAGVQPFIWESSGGESIMHSLSFRLRKRLTRGLAAGGSYTLSKSIDNASSIGGGGSVVAQNDQDLAAERALSSFDQRHRFTGDVSYELPFGANKRWFTSGVGAALFGNWQWNGSVTLASGLPFTPRVVANASDVSRGTNGTLRANYSGAPIQLNDPTSLAFFNTAAFSIPPPGTFGSAGRNIIIGPGSSSANMGLTRNISFSNNRGLSIQILANNIFNTVQWGSIDTVVNSPTFGRVTSVRAMRRVQVLTRIRF